jgi:outer membrane protein TolC
VSRALSGAARRIAAALGIAATLAARPAAAQEALSLRQAITAALRDSDLLKVEEGRFAAAAAGADAARSFLLPKVVLEERFLRTDNPAWDFSTKINQGAFTTADLQGAPASFNDPPPISDFQTSLTVTQPLFARRATLGLAMARGEASAAAQDRTRRREEVAHGALQAWLGSTAAEAALAAAAKAEEDAAEHLRLAEVAEGAGVGLVSDRLQAGVALGEAKRMRLAAENGLEIARRGLGLALGRETAVAPGADDLGAAPADLEALLARVPDRADLRAMGERVDNAGRDVELARAERLPEVGLFGSLQANDPNRPLGTSGTSYSVGVGVTWNIFAGGHAAAAERQAEARRGSARDALAAMAKEARFRIRESWLRWGEARESLRLAAEAVAAAEEGVRLVRVRYENGLATMVALLDGQAALNRARSDEARARAGAGAALGELKFRSGVLLAEVEGGNPR